MYSVQIPRPFSLVHITNNSEKAYFKIGDGEALARQLTAFNIDFGDDSNTTGIDVVDSGQRIVDSSSDAWYTLDGRKLSGEPTKKGLYIKNGKVVVIK